MKQPLLLVTTLIIWMGYLLFAENPPMYNSVGIAAGLEFPTSTTKPAAPILCPEDIEVIAQPGACGAVVNFEDAIATGITAKDQIILTFTGDNIFEPIYNEKGMRLTGFDRDHIDAPWPLPCDNRQGALIHASTGNTWVYNDGEPFTPDRVYVCSTNMRFATGDCGTEFIPTETGDVDFPDTPEWQNITSMTWEEIGGSEDTSIDNFRFTPTAIRQTAGLESGCFFPVGTTVVTYNAIDDSGVETSCSFNVTVLDNEDPVFEVQDITMSLDTNSLLTITAADVLDGNATDNCGIDRIELSNDQFNCSDVGDNTIQVTVVDVNGNSVTKEVRLTITGTSGGVSIDDIKDDSYCDVFEFPEIKGSGLSGMQAYYTQPDGQGISYNAKDLINYAAAATYPLTFYIYDTGFTGPGCKDQESFEVTIVPSPILSDVAEVLSCNQFTFPSIIGQNLTGNEAYYTQQGGSGTRYSAGETIEIDPTLTYPINIFVFDRTAGGCKNEKVFELDLTVCDVEVSITASTTVVCDNELIPILLTAITSPTDDTGDYLYEWRIDGKTEIIGTTETIEVLPEASTTYKVTIIDTGSRNGNAQSSNIIDITVNEAPIAAPDLEFSLCDNSEADGLGFEMINLDTYNDEVSMGIAGLQVTYHRSRTDGMNNANAIIGAFQIATGSNEVFARLTNKMTGCFDVTTINLNLFDPPSLEAITTPISLCATADDSEVNVTIDTQLSRSSYSFEWSVDYGAGSEILSITEPLLVVDRPGIYTITATHLQTGCSATITTVVQPITLPIKATATADLSAVLNNHSIDVVVELEQDAGTTYQVMLNDGPWQEMNRGLNKFTYTFNRVATGNGIQQISIRDTGGCYREIIEVITLGIPQFLTPNNDGYNDDWNIKGLDVLGQQTQLFVFDRYGKLLEDLTLQQRGWNGTFNGEPLPSTDYWYRLELEDGRMVSGHFSLKR